MFTNQLFAQYDIENVKITYGTELEDDKAKIVKLFGEANGTIYALALKGKDNYFIKNFGSTEMNLKTNNLEPSIPTSPHFDSSLSLAGK